MISPLSIEEDIGEDAGFYGEEIRRIRAAYAQSGLYLNDGAATRIWTMRYKDPTHQVYIAPDGKHLVIADDEWHESNGHVVSFFADGRPLATYSATDLVSSFRLKSMLNWPNGFPDCGGMRFDADALTFTSSTTQGESFVFDVTTGKLIRRSSPFPTIIGSALAAIAMAILFLFLFIRRERNAAPRNQEPAANHLPRSSV